MIDWKSTDRSVEIIREICPTWEIRPTKKERFYGEVVDQEVMDIEKTISCWKMCLNTTEFLLTTDLKSYAQKLENDGVQGVRTRGYCIVDHPEHKDEIDHNQHLIMQKTFGFVNPGERGLAIPNPIYPDGTRARLFHRAETGRYAPGRHATSWPTKVDPSFVLCWFNWSPCTEQEKRKKRRGQHVPRRFRRKKRRLFLKGLDNYYRQACEASGDLLQDQYFKEAYDKFKDKFG
jgi:hypothetical protein